MRNIRRIIEAKKSESWQSVKSQRETAQLMTPQMPPMLPAKRQLIIVGAGGYGSLVVAVVDEINARALKHHQEAPWDIVGYADSDTAKRGRLHSGRAVHAVSMDVSCGFFARSAKTTYVQKLCERRRNLDGDPLR